MTTQRPVGAGQRRPVGARPPRPLGGGPRRAAGSLVVPLAGAAPLLALLPSLGRAPLWRDEVATAVAASKTPQALATMLLTRTDASDGLYYALVAPLVRATVDPVWLRLPSAVAVAVAVAVTARTAQRLAGPRAGLLTALLLLAPAATWAYADEARPYAAALAATAVATHLLLVRLPSGVGASGVGASGVGRAGWTPRALAGYGGAGLLAVGLHPMTALLLAGHALAVVVVPGARVLRAGTLRALAVVAVLASPLAVVLATQHGQTSYAQLVRGPDQVEAVVRELLGEYVSWRVRTAAALVAATLAAAAVAAATGAARPVRTASAFLVACAAVPVVLLVGAGAAVHLLVGRYLLWTLPPVALLGGLGTTALVGTLVRAAREGTRSPRAAGPRGRWAAAAAAAVGAAGVLAAAGALVVASASAAARQRTHFGDDLPAVADVLAAGGRAGDAVVYSPTWVRPGVAFFLTERGAPPGRRVVVRDVALRPGVEADRWPDLYLPERSAAATRRLLEASPRIWVVAMPGQTWRPTANTSADVLAALPAAQWQSAGTWVRGDVTISLEVRRTG